MFMKLNRISFGNSCLSVFENVKFKTAMRIYCESYNKKEQLKEKRNPSIFLIALKSLN